MGKDKVLIVEDDSMLCTIFEMFLEDLAYEHSGTFASGEEVLEHLKDEQPDLILMDIHLSGKINGIEAAKQIFLKYNIPIVYISGDSNIETLKNAVFPNIYGYMTKPVYKNFLELNIEFALQKHKLLNK